MKIYIDGDSSNIIRKTESIAKTRNIECHIYCDTKRLIKSEYATVHVIDCGPDAVDFAILKDCEENDIVITNDAGLASMALVKKSTVINTQGRLITDKNINTYLHGRYLRQKEIKRTKRNTFKSDALNTYMSPHNNFASTLNSVIKTQRSKNK